MKPVMKQDPKRAKPLGVQGTIFSLAALIVLGFVHPAFTQFSQDNPGIAAAQRIKYADDYAVYFPVSGRLTKVQTKVFEDGLGKLIADRIAPIAGFSGSLSKSVYKGDSLWINSFELGAGLVDGYINRWGSSDFPLGWDWEYVTLPYLSLSYRTFETFSQSDTSRFAADELPRFMLNTGVSSGAGLLFSLLPFPLGLNVMGGISTDFQDVYFRCRIALDACWISFGAGGYYNLTSKKTPTNNLSYGGLDITLMIWRE